MIDLKDLLKAGVHFGHKASRWSPKMRPFIWGSRNKIHLIDIAKTAFLLERAGKYLKDITSNGGSILWIGTKKSAQKAIENIAKSVNMPFVTNRWIGGTLTNFDQVKKAITRLLHLKDVAEKSTSRLTKKELSMIQKEIGRLEKNIGGIINLKFPPSAIILVDAKKENSAIREAVNANIPIIAMVDTNTDPSNINFIIPSNDDSPRSVSYIIEYLGKQVQDGQKILNETKKKQEIEKKVVKKESSFAKTSADASSFAKAMEDKKATEDMMADKSKDMESEEYKKRLKESSKITTEKKKAETTKEEVKAKTTTEIKKTESKTPIKKKIEVEKKATTKKSAPSKTTTKEKSSKIKKVSAKK